MKLIRRFVLSLMLNLAASEGSISNWTCSQVHRILSEENANYTLVGMLPMRENNDEIFYNSAMSWVEVAKFATKEGNELLQRAGLPIRVSLLFMDYCNDEHLAARAMLEVILEAIGGNRTLENVRNQDKNVYCDCGSPLKYQALGVIGPQSSGSTVLVANMLLPDKVPIVGFSATSTRLGNKEIFPFFQRTIPADNFQTRVIADLLKYYGWTYVSLIVVDNEYGVMGRRETLEVFKEYGICIELDLVLGELAQRGDYIYHDVKIILAKLINTKSRVIVMWIYESLIKILFPMALDAGLLNRTWITTEGIGKSGIVTTFDPRVVTGLITLTPDSGVYLAFEEYFWNISATESDPNPWLRYVYKTNLNFARDGIIKLNQVKHLFNVDFWGSVRNSVFVYFHALVMYSKTVYTQYNCSANFDIFSNEYRASLMKVVFPGLSNQTISFDKFGNMLKPVYKLSALQQAEDGSLYYKSIGDWTEESGIKLSAEFVWAGNSSVAPVSRCADLCQPGFYAIFDARAKCCWTCVSCPFGHFKQFTGNQPCSACPEGSTVDKTSTTCVRWSNGKASLTSYSSVLTYLLCSIGLVVGLTFISIFSYFSNTPVVRSGHKGLTFTQMTFHVLLFAVCPLYLVTPNNFICVLRSLSMGMFLTTILALTMVKTEVLLRIFKLKAKLSRRQLILGRSLVAFVTAFLLLTHLAIFVVYLLHNPTIKELKRDNSNELLYLTCLTDDVLPFQLAYTLILCTICGIQAFRARSLPQSYNEAKFIYISMFTASIVIVTWFPLNYSFVREESRMLATVVVICAVNLAMLLLMFGSKLYVILFHPDKNNNQVFRQIRISAVNIIS